MSATKAVEQAQDALAAIEKNEQGRIKISNKMRKDFLKGYLKGHGIGTFGTGLLTAKAMSDRAGSWERLDPRTHTKSQIAGNAAKQTFWNVLGGFGDMTISDPALRLSDTDTKLGQIALLRKAGSAPPNAENVSEELAKMTLGSVGT